MKIEFADKTFDNSKFEVVEMQDACCYLVISGAHLSFAKSFLAFLFSIRTILSSKLGKSFLESRIILQNKLLAWNVCEECRCKELRLRLHHEKPEKSSWETENLTYLTRNTTLQLKT